jgi:hypothetical protein
MKRSVLNRAAGVAVALGLTLATAALSRVPWGPAVHDHAVIRLSWRTPGEFVNECRTPTAEELAALPIHMRRDEICEGRILPKRLRVLLDGREEIDEVVRAAGAREDRPLYVYREIPVPPGDHSVVIEWGTENGPSGSRQGLQAQLRLAAGEIALLTYDVDRRELVVRGGAADPTLPDKSQ